MALNETAERLFQGFSKLNRKERFQRLIQMGALTSEDVSYLSDSASLQPTLAEKLIENVIGYFHLPLGVTVVGCDFSDFNDFHSPFFYYDYCKKSLSKFDPDSLSVVHEIV